MMMMMIRSSSETVLPSWHSGWLWRRHSSFTLHMHCSASSMTSLNKTWSWKQLQAESALCSAYSLSDKQVPGSGSPLWCRKRKHRNYTSVSARGARTFSNVIQGLCVMCQMQLELLQRQKCVCWKFVGASLQVHADQARKQQQYQEAGMISFRSFTSVKWSPLEMSVYSYRQECVDLGSRF